MGVNLPEALRQGQIDVGLVQEPALTLPGRSGACLRTQWTLKTPSIISAVPLNSRCRGAHWEIEQRRPEMVALDGIGRWCSRAARDDR
jgi:NitT/TauT family transport system substrate-binding protein